APPRWLLEPGPLPRRSSPGRRSLEGTAYSSRRWGGRRDAWSDHRPLSSGPPGSVLEQSFLGRSAWGALGRSAWGARPGVRGLGCSAWGARLGVLGLGCSARAEDLSQRPFSGKQGAAESAVPCPA